MLRMRGAFTLIELLIVVAIIAILAAIAVPNFLEAQVRSKVSRCKSDLRSLATALEAYRTDNNNYPWGDTTTVYGLAFLTSPIAYITSLPVDPFAEKGVGTSQGLGAHRWAPHYYYIGGYTPGTPEYALIVWGFRVNTLQQEGPAGPPGTDARCPALWEMRSLGPIREWSYSLPYDPSNGTVSVGDISLFGPGNPGIF